MGGITLLKTRSLEQYFPNFHPQDWIQTPITLSQGKNRFGDYVTLRNRVTNEEIDKYLLTFYSQKEQRIYEDCFMQRLREEYLVNAFHYQPLQNQGICSSIRSANVYIQHIPIRLSDITDIPIDQSIYILKCALYGFEKLFKESGYFQVMEQLVGIDKEGHVRVWLNADVSKNYPYGFDEDPYQGRDSQKKMVKEIISLIEQNTSYTIKIDQQNGQSISHAISFSSYLEKINVKNPNFMQAEQHIQQYANKNQIQIPKHCHSIVEIFHEDYGQNFNLVSDDENMSQNLDIGGNQLFANALNSSSHTHNNRSLRNSHHSHQSRHSSNKFNLETLRSQGQNNYNTNQNRLNSSNQDQSSNQPLLFKTYKEYEPTSAYRPNQKSNRMSDMEVKAPSYKEPRMQSKRSHSSDQSQSLRGSAAMNGSRAQSQSQNQNYNQNRNGNLMDSSSFINWVQNSAELGGMPYSIANLRKSSTSSENMSIRSNPNIPKVTFNYMNPTDFNNLTNSNKFCLPKPQQPNRMVRISEISNENSREHEMEMQFKRDIQKSLRQSEEIENNSASRTSSFHRDFSRKEEYYYNEDAIQQNSQDDEKIDPMILRDLLKEYPNLSPSINEISH